MSIELRRLATTTAPGGTAPSASLRVQANGPRVFIIGTGERADLATPPGLLPRHIAILTVPYPDGVQVRVLALHPDRGVVHLRRERDPDALDDVGGTLSTPVGGVVGVRRVEALFDGYLVDVVADLEREGDVVRIPSHEPAILAKGEQLAFYNGASVRPVGNVVASVSGPGGGGHAVPALVADMGEVQPEPGSLVLRSRGGVHRLEPSLRDLRRGVLIGRSRRCVLGRGFDENDGLSRLHALVMMVDDGVYAFDLASRYGLREVARPNRLVQTARLDDGVGCLVYGAGHLVYER